MRDETRAKFAGWSSESHLSVYRPNLVKKEGRGPTTNNNVLHSMVRSVCAQTGRTQLSKLFDQSWTHEKAMFPLSNNTWCSHRILFED